MSNEIQYHICHYCCNYITPYKKNIIYHFSKKKKCSCLTLLSHENAKDLSILKKFIINFDTSTLTKDDILYIVNKYSGILNIINKDFKKSNQIKNNEVKNEIIESTENTITIDENKRKDILYEKCYNKELNKYICPDCNSEYTTKQNLIKHFENLSLCKQRQLINEKLKIHDEKCSLMKIKEDIQNEINKLNIINNQQNILNNNNVQNNNNNTQNNTYNFAMRDFVHEKYDLTHINDSFYEKKDFFIYPNFLRVIMENKKNQNIFFSENEAIIYSDKELNKMSSDKAGYMVLDKLSQSFDQLLNKQDAEAREYYSFITKYYSVLKGQYKHDTIYKEYDVDERRFYYTANSSLFRSRDKYLSKIVTTVNKCNDNARENMNIAIQDIKSIPMINPNIEDYASVRMRYRDLKEKSY